MCDKADRVHKLMEHRDQTPNLKYIITADGILPEDVEKAKQYGVQIIKFADLEVLVFQTFVLHVFTCLISCLNLSKCYYMGMIRHWSMSRTGILCMM